MPDELDAHVLSALHTLEQEPSPDGRAAVSRRVRQRRIRRASVGVAAIAATTLIAVNVVQSDPTPRRVAVGNDVTTTVGSPSALPAPPALSAAGTGILTYPTTIAAGGDVATVLRNPLSGANVACFLVVHLERWDGRQWNPVRDLLAKGTDPNLTGPGADCAPDLILPGAFIGEQTFTIPSDAAPGTYRLVDRATEGEGRINVVPAGTETADESLPISETSIDLAQGTKLSEVHASPVERAVLLDDNRLALSWDSSCNTPAQRVELDYRQDVVEVRLFVGFFLVTDCVGEPERWSTIIDLPAPLWGREVKVDAGGDEKTAERFDAAPLSMFVLPGIAPGSVSPPIVATSIFRQRLTPVSIQADVFAGVCIADAQSVVLRAGNGEVFVQPHVQVVDNPEPGDSCIQGPGFYPDELHVALPAGTSFFGPTG